MCRTHRYDHISLLHFCPGEVLQELVVRHAAKVVKGWILIKDETKYFDLPESSSNPDARFKMHKGVVVMLRACSGIGFVPNEGKFDFDQGKICSLSRVLRRKF